MIPQLPRQDLTPAEAAQIDRQRQLQILRALKAERVWDWTVATIDNQTDPTPAHALAVAQARNDILDLRDRLNALQQ